jgi:hypothetical protein
VSPWQTNGYALNMGSCKRHAIYKEIKSMKGEIKKQQAIESIPFPGMPA